MAGFATRPSFAGHTGSSAKTNHELTSTPDHQMGAGQQRSRTALSHAEELQFVPAVLDVAPSSPSVRRQRKMPRGQGEPGAGMIEVEIDGVTVRVGRGADAKTVRAVLRALKARA